MVPMNLQVGRDVKGRGSMKNKKRNVEKTTTKIGQKLRQARTARALSLQELAETVGTSASYLSKIETGGIREPSSATLVRLAKVFEWTLDELYDLFYSEEETQLDQQIAILEAELRSQEQAQLVISGSQALQNDRRGKSVYLALLQELKTRLGP